MYFTQEITDDDTEEEKFDDGPVNPGNFEEIWQGKRTIDI
jgi:hypothetical protein